MADSEKTARPSIDLAQEQPLSLPPSRVRQAMCFLALGPPGYEEHWTSAQCNEAFEEVSGRIQSVVMKCIFTSGGLTLASLHFMNIARIFPPYFDYPSSTASSLLDIAFVMSASGQCAGMPYFMAFLVPGIPKYLLKRGCFLLGVYYFTYLMPVFYAACALHVFLFAMLINGFFSENIAYRVLGAFSLVTYVVVVRILLMRFRKRGANPRFKSV